MAAAAAAATTKQLQLTAAAKLPAAPPCCPLFIPRSSQRSHDYEAEMATTTGRWRSPLASGLRAALACTIVGLVSLYAPPALRRHITFPAFSYVVTVIIVTDATLGTALRGAMSALHATLMGAAPSVVALWLAHHTGAAESVLATSAVVALTAFAVALPESVGAVAKRIALGQTIIVYVALFQRGEHPSRAFALLHPANVVACTALGVIAALLAVLLPWPRLATREARDKRRAYRVFAAERVRVLCDAFILISNGTAACCSRQQRWQMAACMSEANRLASASTALRNRINAVKEDLQWERGAVVVDDNKQSGIEMSLTGMQIALAMMLDANASGGHGGGGNMVVDVVMAMRDQIRLALLTPPSRPSNSKHAQQQPSMPTLPQQKQQLLPPFLFLFSLYQLHRRCCGVPPEEAVAAAVIHSNANKVAPAGQELSPTGCCSPSDEDDDDQQARRQEQVHDPPQADDDPTTTKQHQQHWPRRRRQVVAAAKCGFSLGLAVLLGLLFSNDHGFWSGLIVATTITVGRESTWVVAVARAHGTALGSVYGALGCLLISQQQQQRLLAMDLRFLLAILPWMVLSAFLKRSRTYGPVGGVAAALSVVIIVGRRYDEAPMAFTMARLVETFIGISCAVLADLVFQPGARPSVRAREQLTRCIAALSDCFAADDPLPSCSQSQSQSRLKRVQQQLSLLRKYAAEAGGEPTYLWLPPFPAACYDKIQGSLGRMAQLLLLYHQAADAERIMLSSQQPDLDVDDDMILQRRFSSLVSTSLSHCLRMLLPPNKQSPSPDPAPHQQQESIDLEAGTGTGSDAVTRCCCCCKEAHQEATTPEQLVGSFPDQAAALLDDNDREGEADERGLLLSCLGSIALCMVEIVKEVQRLEAHILDLNSLQPTMR